MELDTLAKLGEFVGGFFVVVSLVYLAHQVRQNTRSLRTENYARVLDRMSALQAQLSADSELNRIVVVGAGRPEALERQERVRFGWAMYELFGAAEFMYHQAVQKALPAEVWTRWQKTVAWWFSHPGIRTWWDNKPTPLSSDFESFVEDLLRSHQIDEEAARRWELFVSGEGLPDAGAITSSSTVRTNDRDTSSNERDEVDEY